MVGDEDSCGVEKVDTDSDFHRCEGECDELNPPKDDVRAFLAVCSLEGEDDNARASSGSSMTCKRQF